MYSHQPGIFHYALLSVVCILKIRVILFFFYNYTSHQRFWYLEPPRDIKKYYSDQTHHLVAWNSRLSKEKWMTQLWPHPVYVFWFSICVLYTTPGCCPPTIFFPTSCVHLFTLQQFGFSCLLLVKNKLTKKWAKNKNKTTNILNFCNVLIL